MTYPAGRCTSVMSVGYIDVFDIKNYTKVFSEKKESLCCIRELKTGSFALSYEGGKIEIANIDIEAKKMEVIQELIKHDSDVYDLKELSNGNIVSCSNNGQIIVWSLNPSLNKSANLPSTIAVESIIFGKTFTSSPFAIF